MKTIKLTDGYEAIVDDEDYPYLSRFNWVASNKGCENGKIYAQMNKQKGKKTTFIAMHEFVVNFENADRVSFKNGNTLDYRKENLIEISYSEMIQRSTKRKQQNSSSNYKGLTYRKSKDCWEVRIANEGQTYYLGSFKDERTAALAYNKKAKELYGEYAYQNNLNE